MGVHCRGGWFVLAQSLELIRSQLHLVRRNRMQSSNTVELLCNKGSGRCSQAGSGSPPKRAPTSGLLIVRKSPRRAVVTSGFHDTI